MHHAKLALLFVIPLVTLEQSMILPQRAGNGGQGCGMTTLVDQETCRCHLCRNVLAENWGHAASSIGLVTQSMTLSDPSDDGGQGCGKTTLVEQLEALFEHTGGKAAVFSMDDCYLTRADQEALAKVSFHLIHPPNDLGAGRPETPPPPPPPAGVDFSPTSRCCCDLYAGLMIRQQSFQWMTAT